MQPTEIQVQRSLHALQESSAPFGHDDPFLDLSELPIGLVDRLVDIPTVRVERVIDARMRMVAGEHPSDDDLAGRMVGRLVCDRLR